MMVMVNHLVILSKSNIRNFLFLTIRSFDGSGATLVEQRRMSAAGLGEHRYGKSRIRVVHVDRTNDARHIVTELSVDVYLWGDFARSFLKGDNSTTVPTDTMKNTVYALAKIHPVTPVESFAQAVANHFKTKYKQGTSTK